MRMGEGQVTRHSTIPLLPPSKDTNPDIGVESIKKLLDTVDEWIPDPVREVDKPFLMPVDGVYSIPGRGTVVTGRVERGQMRKGDAAEFVGLKSQIKTTVTGEEQLLLAVCTSLPLAAYHPLICFVSH